jgi:phospholipid transport system substrate-binding protein
MKRMTITKISLMFLLIIAWFGVVGVQVALAGPTDDLKPVLADLTRVLGEESLKGPEHTAERRGKIMSLIKRGFDFQEMSKRVLGSTWNEISQADQEHFTELMIKLLENVYIGKLESYSGQTIEYADEKVRGDRAQVSVYLMNGTVKIPISYILKKTPERWMVYDINIEGVSLVRNYQEQFKSILRTEKFAGLVKTLEEKNKSFAQEQ